MRRSTRWPVLALLILLWPASAFAQERTPQPYTADEFPQWLKDLRRAEIVFVGSFPITLFVTLESYDTYRYIFIEKLDAKYTPWPFGSGAPYVNGETPWLALTAVSLSVVVAAVDFLLGRINAPAPDH